MKKEIIIIARINFKYKLLITPCNFSGYFFCNCILFMLCSASWVVITLLDLNIVVVQSCNMIHPNILNHCYYTFFKQIWEKNGWWMSVNIILFLHVLAVGKQRTLIYFQFLYFPSIEFFVVEIIIIMRNNNVTFVCIICWCVIRLPLTTNCR